eukprot:gene13896-15344_t
MEIPIPSFIQHPDKVYHKEVLLKKETSKVWTEYYAVLCDHYLIFNRKNSQTGFIIPNDCTILELTSHSKVLYTRKKCYRFPFEIETDKLKYTFKCDTNLQRYRWVFAIRRAIEGKPPIPPTTRSSKRNLPRKDDKSLKKVSKASTNRRNLRGSSRANNNNSSENDFYLNARHNVATLSDEDDLNHSSTAVRLQASKNSLLLTNKSAFAVDEATAAAEYRNQPRRLSRPDNDLKIVDIDDDEDSIQSKSRESLELEKLNVADDATNQPAASDENNTLERESYERVQRKNSKSKDEGQNFRLYPDQVKSYSWSSLGILRRTPTHRLHSAPSMSHRFQRPQLKVTFSPSTK